MILFPNCKINIGLDILRRRPDGYHDIETVMYPVFGLCDGLEIIRDPESTGATLTTSGLPPECPPEKNLVMLAYELVRQEYGIGGVRMHLHKKIPAGAGLGGGSSDAAFTIRALDGLFGLGMTRERMESLASMLGSDVPFFIRNTPQLCTGRGEVMSPVEVPLKGKYIAIIKPDIHISTAEAYAGATPSVPAVGLAGRIARPIAEWTVKVANAFEKNISATHPQIGLLKKSLYSDGAEYASMTGSGSAVYGIFENKPCLYSADYGEAHIFRL